MTQLCMKDVLFETNKIVMTADDGTQFILVAKDAINEVAAVIPAVNDNACVYVLFDRHLNPMYVGQSKKGIGRVKTHIRECQKDFSFFSVASFAQTINLDFIEESTIGYFKSKQFPLMNGTNGNSSNLSPVQKISHNQKADAYTKIFHSMKNIAQVMFDAVECEVETIEVETPEIEIEPEVQTPELEGKHSPVVSTNPMKFHLKVPGANINAIGIMEYGISKSSPMTILAGSIARNCEIGSFTSGNGTGKARQVRKFLIETGVMKLNSEGLMEFTADYVFENSALAATVCYAGTINARDKWVHADTSKTLKETQASLV